MKKINFKIGFSPITKLSLTPLGEMTKFIIDTKMLGSATDSVKFLFPKSSFGILVGKKIRSNKDGFFSIKLYTGEVVQISKNVISAYYPVNVTIATVHHLNTNFRHTVFGEVLLHELNTVIEWNEKERIGRFESLYSSLYDGGGKILDNQSNEKLSDTSKEV
jgi:hypothetical protein